jgi:hypothetical protein
MKRKRTFEQTSNSIFATSNTTANKRRHNLEDAAITSPARAFIELFASRESTHPGSLATVTKILCNNAAYKQIADTYQRQVEHVMNTTANKAVSDARPTAGPK